MPSPVTLFQSCDVFLKRAGLIKAPQNMINTISEWAVSVFCHKLVHGYLIPHTIPRLEWRKPGGKQILQAHERAKEIKQEWEWLNNLMASARRGEETLDRTRVVIKVPHYERSRDPTTGVFGFVDRTLAPLLFLSIEHKNGKLLLYLSIYGNEVYNTLIPISGINIYSKLDKYEGRIREISMEYVEFLNDPAGYQSSTNNQIYEAKQLIAFCNAKIKTDTKPQQQFVFPISSVFPSNNSNVIPGIKDIQIDAAFAGNQAEQGSEEWKGLWEEKIFSQWEGIATSGRRTLHLGRLSVGRLIYMDLYNILASHNRMEALEDVLDDIHTTVRHEVEHAVQSFGIATGKATGLPAERLREKGYTPSGVSRMNANEPRLEHSLRDLEFYTNLADSVSVYRRVISKVPLYMRPQFLRSWVALDGMLSQAEVIKAIQAHENKNLNDSQWDGINEAIKAVYKNRPLFEQLFEYQQNRKPRDQKYTKVVHEFIKAVG